MLNKFMINKKTVLFLSVLGSLCYAIMHVLVSVSGCVNSLFFCNDSNLWLIDVLRLFPMLLIISLVLYKLHENIYKTWLKFTYIWLPLSVILIWMSPEYDRTMIPMDRGRVSFIMSVLFLVISIVIIIYKSVSNKNKI